MLNQVEIEQAVVIQIHRNGKWTRTQPLNQVLRYQFSALVEGKELDWYSLAISPNQILANKKVAKLRKELRAKSAEIKDQSPADESQGNQEETDQAEPGDGGGVSVEPMEKTDEH